VSSGVEYEIGKKDPQKVRDFIKNAKVSESKKSEERL
jgi:phosphoribosylanthranilate isomerase